MVWPELSQEEKDELERSIKGEDLKRVLKLRALEAKKEKISEALELAVKKKSKESIRELNKMESVTEREMTVIKEENDSCLVALSDKCPEVPKEMPGLDCAEDEKEKVLAD